MAEAPKLDPWKSATNNNDEEKAKMLAAAATAGTAGLKAYDEAKAGNAVTQQAALAAAQQGAGGNAFGPVGTGGMADLGNLQSQALETARAGFGSGMEQMKASNESYMGKLGATLPILQEQNQLKYAASQAQLEARVAERARLEKAAADAAALRRQQEIEDRDFAAKLAADQMRFQGGENQKNRDVTASAAASKAAAASAPKPLTELSDSELSNYLMGSATNTQALAAKQLEGPLARSTAAAQGAANKGFSMNMDGRPNTARQLDPVAFTQKTAMEEVVNTPLGALARQLGVNVAGLDPNRVYGIITEQLTKPSEADYVAKQANVNGGGTVVAQILQKPEVRQFMELTGAVQATDAQIKEAIRVQFPGDTNKNVRQTLEYVLL